MKRIITATLLLATMASCSKEPSYSSEGSDVVKFSSAAIETKVSADGTMWSATESIGISMYDVDGSLVESPNISNVKYTSTNTEESTSVDFAVATDESALLYPNTGSVKFYAYYPYQNIGNSEIYTANVSDQSTDIDFMIASTEVTSRTDEAEELVFEHMLSKITLNISCNDTVTDLTGVTAEVVGLSTTGKYDILTGDLATGTSLSDSNVAISLVMGYDDDDETIATATAIVLPETLSAAATITFTIGEETFTASIASGSTFTVGKNHTYSVKLGQDETSISGATISAGWNDEPQDDLYSEYFGDEVLVFTNSDIKAKLTSGQDIDTNGDYEISYAEAAAFTGSLGLNNITTMSTVENLQYFKNITALILTNCYILTSLDLSANTKLTTLWLDGCWQLPSLDISQCPELEYLNCHGCSSLTQLDLSYCPKLDYLNCKSCSLTSLDLSDVPELTTLVCTSNKSLMELDLSTPTNMTSLECSVCALTELDLSAQTKLTTLVCDDNSLLELDLSGLDALTNISCFGNNLTSIDISNCTKLQSFSCNINEIESLDLSKNLDLKSLYCDNNALTSLDVSSNEKLYILNCYSNHLSTLDISMCDIGLSSEYYDYYVVVGSQTEEEDGITAKELTLTITTAQSSNIQTSINTYNDNAGVTVNVKDAL